MEHLTYEFDSWWLVGVLFLKMHDKSESAIFEGRICWADNDSIPAVSAISVMSSNKQQKSIHVDLETHTRS